MFKSPYEIRAKGAHMHKSPTQLNATQCDTHSHTNNTQHVAVTDAGLCCCTELRGELIRWNHWHSWDLKPSATTSYPKPPAKYDPLNPTRPNIRKQRLEREAAH
jgi:hypothetical protein